MMDFMTRTVRGLLSEALYSWFGVCSHLQVSASTFARLSCKSILHKVFSGLLKVRSCHAAMPGIPQ